MCSNCRYKYEEDDLTPAEKIRLITKELIKATQKLSRARFNPLDSSELDKLEDLCKKAEKILAEN